MDGVTLLIFFLAALVLMLGFAGQVVFKRTSVPDVIWLVLFGILLSFFLAPEQKALLITFAGPFGALALLMIMFDAGMGFNFVEFAKGIPRGILLAILGMILTAGITAVLTHYLLGWEWIYGILLGAAVGGTSSSIVIPIATKLNISEYLKSFLTVESTATDVFTVVFVIAIIDLILAGTADMTIAAQGVIAAFSIGIAIGFFGALAWVFLLQRIERELNSFLFDFVIVLLLYVFAEFIGGSGVIAGLTFAISLGNLNTLGKIVVVPEGSRVTRSEKAFYSELDFFVRTFFFVYLGIIFDFSNVFYLGIGLFLTVIYLVFRMFAAHAALLGTQTSALERNLSGGLMARGLAAAVVSQTPLLMLAGKVGPAEEAILKSFAPIVLGVVFFSILATVLVVYFLGKELPKEPPQKEEPKPQAKKQAKGASS